MAWGTVFLGSPVLVLLMLCASITWGYPNSQTLQSPRVISARTFRIGVLGDAQKGLANFSKITQAVLKEEVDFMIQTGDLVATNDQGHYRLAEQYLKRGGAQYWPYVVPGNHDLKGGTERFQQWFGDLEKTFTVGSVAFVILNDANGIPPDPTRVEERIRAAGPHEAVVLAMHVPPFDAQEVPRPEFRAFLEWLEKSRVSYLLCGHAHGYFKKKVGDTTVVVNGVGGDYDSWQFDQRVYATILDVDGAGITDRTLELPPVHEVWENVEHLAVGHVAEAYRRRPMPCWGATALLCLLIAGATALVLQKPSAAKQ
ncbi:MAG TPA: metallophosphoesterase [Planctomycetota bacterium]|nr:metallophosphoesterase [Planctomycetota bacterium]